MKIKIKQNKKQKSKLSHLKKKEFFETQRKGKKIGQYNKTIETKTKRKKNANLPIVLKSNRNQRKKKWSKNENEIRRLESKK